MEIVLKEEQVHGLIVILTPQVMTQIEETAELIGNVAKQYQKPILCSFMGGSLVAKGEKILNEHKIPSFRYPERAIKSAEEVQYIAQTMRATEEALGHAIEVIRTFADRCHHGKEEKHLFRTIAERGVPVEGGPIGAMLIEHEQGRAYVRAMRTEGEKYAAGTLTDPAALVRAVRSYVGLLRAHIQKEDRILYPLGEQVLTPTDRQALAEAYERVEREEMGEGEHERFHAMIDQLEQVVGR